MLKEKVAIFWFRRDLRIEDNRGLLEALQGKVPVLPIFIFDTHIIRELEKNDARVSFIYEQLLAIDRILKQYLSGLYIVCNSPENAWKQILEEYDVQNLYFNEDYEPYARERDQYIKNLLKLQGTKSHSFKDHVIFAKNEILKANQEPYTVYTPYKNKWLQKFKSPSSQRLKLPWKPNFIKHKRKIPSLEELGFKKSNISVLAYDLTHLQAYDKNRNFPALNKTSHLSVHLRFGTVSIRSIVQKVVYNESFLNELIWRDFFSQILFHYPKVVSSNFKSKYDNILWRNNENEFESWKNGKTGYPMVDAGMRELNATGYMHNRVRMITAGFLCKHLLIDWRWGEAYFASKLLDYDLASNNGNWQWAAGTGCDAAPYFRIFNPAEQLKKFDNKQVYVKQWIEEYGSKDYSQAIVEHKFARMRALERYKQGIQ